MNIHIYQGTFLLGAIFLAWACGAAQGFLVGRDDATFALPVLVGTIIALFFILLLCSIAAPEAWK